MAPTDPEQRDEIRFAVVLNGGVSLAVWIGGVTLEIDRLTRRDRVYGQLLDLLDLQARADVITGTSAGGINGAALALAQVNDSADLRNLRDMWASQGRMETLLRTPFRGEPASLLKGDEYFLPSLESALRGLAADYTSIGADRRPVHLGITATLIDGVRHLETDALGQQLPQEMHAGLLRFRHSEHRDVPDDFDRDAVGETVRRLALAARTSASFPVAFEPSFLPVGSTTPDPLGRPDMSSVADWYDETVGGDQSRYALDGGAMLNTPTGPALDVIGQLPASSAVRRVMLLVFPHAPVDFEGPTSTPSDPPTVVESLMGASGASRNESSRTHVEVIDAHNRRAADRRSGRADAIVSLQRAAAGEQHEFGAKVHGLAGDLFVNYRDLRLRRAARDLAGRVPSVPGWSYGRVLAAVDRAQAAAEALPYVPEAYGEPLLPPAGWPWGVTTAEHVVDDAQDLLRRLIRLPLEDADRDLVRQHRATLSVVKEEVQSIRRTFDGVWAGPAFRDLEPNQAYWAARLHAQRLAYVGGDPLTRDDLDGVGPGDVDAVVTELNRVLEPGRLGARVRAALDTLGQSLLRVLPVVRKARAASAGDTTFALRAWESLLAESANPEELLPRLIELDVVVSTLTHGADSGGDFHVELVQVSLQTQNAFAQTTTAAGDKLGGARLNRFAGFLKESWRINDWMWGRIDAATMLCRVLLDPARLRHARTTSAPGSAEWPPTPEEWVDLWATRLFPGRQPGAGFSAKKQEAVWEMRTYVYADAVTDLPPSLPGVADLFAWAIQADAVAEDLPALRNAVLADRRDGASQNSSGERLVDEHADLITRLSHLAPMPLARTLDPVPRPVDLDAAEVERRDLGLAGLVAFDRAGVGREALDKEATGDQMIRTAVSAIAVGATVLDSPKLGFAPVKPLTRTIRGLALLPYWVTRGLTGAGRIAQTLAMVALALGASMLALALVFPGTPRWVVLIGVSAALFALGYAALRTGSFLHGLVLLTPVVPLTTFAVAEQLDSESDTVATVSVLPCALALIAGVVVLGSLPGLVRSPFAILGDHARSTWTFVIDLLLVPVLVVPVLLVLVDAGANGRYLAAGVLAALAVVATAAYRLSGGFRVRYFGTDHVGTATRIVLPGVVVAGLVSVLVAWGIHEVGQEVTVAAVGLLVVALVAALVLRHRSRRRVLVTHPDGADAGWRRERVVQPVAVAVAWAAVYAAAFAYVGGWLLVAVVASDSAPSVTFGDGLRLSEIQVEYGLSSLETTLWVSMLAAWVFAAVLGAAVFLLAWKARAAVRRRIEREMLSGEFRVGETDEQACADLLARLNARGTAYAYLTTPRNGDLVLSGAGRSMARRLSRMARGAAG